MNNEAIDLKDVLATNDDEEEVSVPKYNSMNSMKDILEKVDSQIDNSYNKPWSKLNKSNKLVLLDKYIETINLKNNIKNNKQLKTLLHRSLNMGLLNKQSDVGYNMETNLIENITILEYDESTKQYSLKNNEVKVKTNKSKSKSNIDKILNRSKSNR